MACRNAYRTNAVEAGSYQTSITVPVVANNVIRLLFGVDSRFQANDLLLIRKHPAAHLLL